MAGWRVRPVGGVLLVPNGRVWTTGGGAASRRGGSTAAVPNGQVLELEAGPRPASACPATGPPRDPAAVRVLNWGQPVSPPPPVFDAVAIPPAARHGGTCPNPARGVGARRGCGSSRPSRKRRSTARLTARPLTRRAVLAMIKRLAAAAGPTALDVLSHPFRATGAHGVSVERGGLSAPSRSPNTGRPRRPSSTTGRPTG